MSTKITLLEWFDLNQMRGKRCSKKLQRWVKEELFAPMPTKIGRSYEIEPTAKKIERKKSKVSLHILEQAKSDALKMMYLDRETVLSNLLAELV